MTILKRYSFLILVFTIIMLANILTPLIADDFTYYYSFATGEEITDVIQIIPSMIAHRNIMNGRIVSHFLVQLFEMFPKWTFDVINSFVFIFQLLLIQRFSFEEKKNPLFVLIAFASIWLFQPAFGEVNLWMDGAVNYLWASTFLLVWLIPFIDMFMRDRLLENKFCQIMFVVYSLIIGAYSENGTPAAVAIGALILFIRILYKQKTQIYQYVSIIVAFIGYCFMVFAPASLTNKGVSLSSYSIMRKFNICSGQYLEFGFILLDFIICIYLVIRLKIKTKKIALAFIFLAGSLFSNYLMMAAKYYTDRSAFFSFILLLISVLCFIDEIRKNKELKIPCIISFTACICAFAIFLVIGFKDISSTYKQIKANYEYIAECKENGIEDITIKDIDSETFYSAINGLKFVDCNNENNWPNNSMAKYFGVKTIKGKK